MSNKPPRLTRVTLTGADQRTDLASLKALTDQFRFLEIGLLYSERPEGRNRYPDKLWLHEASCALYKRCALHVCGSLARGHSLHPRMAKIVEKCSRVQINGIVSHDEFWHFNGAFPDFITQHNRRNEDLVDYDSPRHSVLVDGSGGRGILPGEWHRPETPKRVGFAGGLNPENVNEQLQSIFKVAEGDFWIDMENGVRTDDWFDLRKARLIAEAVAPMIKV